MTTRRTPPARSARRAAVAATALLALTACGSTVQLSGTGTTMGGPGSGTVDEIGTEGLGGTTSGAGGATGSVDGSGSGSGGSTSGSAFGGTGGTGSAGGATGGSTTGSTGATGGTGAGRGGSTSGTGGATGTSVTTQSGTVKVGVLYLDGADALAAGLGIDNLSTGDALAQTKAIVTHLNTRGGLNGKKIVLTGYGINASQLSSDPNSATSAACAALTQDQAVQYVVSYISFKTAYLACYAKAGVPVLNDLSGLADGSAAKFQDVFAAPGDMLPGRSARVMVDALFRTGWLTRASKVGTLVYDTPDGVSFEQQYLLPALKAKGITPAVTIRSSDQSDAVAASLGSVLQMRSAGVDRVIPIGASPLFLMTAAQSQDYHPLYALTSTFAPGALLEGTAPPAQLKGAAGIGWYPYLDLGKGKNPGPVSANETTCLTLMKNAGQVARSNTTRGFQLSLCDTMFWLEAAAKKVGEGPGLLARARAAMGTSFSSPSTFRSVAAPGRADGVAGYRDLRFDDACTCFQYSGPLRSAS